MSRPAKIPTEVRVLILWVARIRKDLPSEKQLARMAGVSVSAVQKLIERAQHQEAA